MSELYNTDAESIRTSLRLELASNIVEDQKAISGRLGLELVSSQLVDDCHSQLLRDKKDDIESLQDIVARAESKSDNANVKLKEEFETHMYKPLVDIIDYIASFGGSTPKRRWIHSEAHVIGNGMPYSKPDLRLGDPSGELKTWRDLAAFGEVKPKAVQGMAPGQAIKGSDALVESSDYARLHLAGSPFRLFSIALMITGNNFQVAIFDRAGVVVSPAANIWTDTKTFIRVIRRLSCNLSHIEMGCDPSVFELPSHAELYPLIRKKAKSLGVPRDSLDYPSFLVQCRKRISTLDGMDTRSRPDRDRDDWETHEWLTIGPPVWVSLSLLGRGTSIWRVMPYKEGDFDSSAEVCILKNTWRNSRRVSESEIYETVERGPDGVANFHYGGDAVFPWIATSPAISVVNLRNTDYRINRANLLDIPTHRSIDPTPMLHRLILKTVGRPLWDALDYIDLLKGFRAALLGHAKLCKQGILHRDISAGNILLAVGAAEEGKEGFITDLEFARLRQIRQTRTRVNDDGTETMAKAWTDTTRGLLMTGTVQFMATAKLNAFRGTPSAARFTDQVNHDLESFIWVFAYTVMRRLMIEKRLDSDSRKHIHQWFKECFCSLSIATIIPNRIARIPLKLPIPIDHGILPDPIQDLLAWLDERVQYNQPANERLAKFKNQGRNVILIVRPLTHELLLDPIETMISELQ
ncbi:hypothetical protein PC9H_007030 [Pleurotus ostreatus]|uniref:Fungal-type protein kinase domain-containing protein n=1 Tax=Pleurotus ostreatus TaxID=5322 RepID=A0A8H6ZTC8_PLEOS|nr:uncharacterized protein PC9H_007030 [Pleurotus ostreatus]KAF7427814.1 hypothetical protein PC9H_007030 [Pleurotus ostreatus]KAJ8695800.1 hypothetical protein PTI98_005727 [Pleurotus ostreatus]